MRKISSVPAAREPDARYLAMPAIFVDSCVLIEVLADDPMRLLTRDAVRYANYFPKLALVTP